MSTLSLDHRLAIILSVRGSSLSSFVCCCRDHRHAWNTSPAVQAKWLMTQFSAQQQQQQQQQQALTTDTDPNDLEEAWNPWKGPLFRALRSNNLAVLREVLAYAACAAVQREVDAALHMAVLSSHSSCLQHLLNYNTHFRADVNARICGLTAAHLAAFLDKPVHLRLLLESPGSDGSLLSQNRGPTGTVLHIAVDEGHQRCVRTCLGAPAAAQVDVNQLHGNGFGRTALHFAAMWNDAAVVRLLAGAPGIDVNAKDVPVPPAHVVFSPLQLAAMFGCPASLGALLEAEDIDVDCVDWNGWSVLYMAAKSSNLTWSASRNHAPRERSAGLAAYTECVRLLLSTSEVNIHFKLGVDAEIPSRAHRRKYMGHTALTAASYGNNKAAATLLTQAGVGGPLSPWWKRLLQIELESCFTP